MVIALWILMAILVGVWASKWNRNGLTWTMIAFLFSPLIGALFLLIAGNDHPNCPNCQSKYKKEQYVCASCGHQLKTRESTPSNATLLYEQERLEEDQAESPVSPEEKECPFCAETIKYAAIKCKHCGSDLQEA